MLDDDNVLSLLVVILDTNPVWWGRNSTDNPEAEETKTFVECVNQIIAFGNAHLTMNRKNKLAVIALQSDGSHFLYPLPEQELEAIQDENLNGKHETLVQMNVAVSRGIENMLKHYVVEVTEVIAVDEVNDE